MKLSGISTGVTTSFRLAFVFSAGVKVHLTAGLGYPDVSQKTVKADPSRWATGSLNNSSVNLALGGSRKF